MPRKKPVAPPGLRSYSSTALHLARIEWEWGKDETLEAQLKGHMEDFGGELDKIHTTNYGRRIATISFKDPANVGEFILKARGVLMSRSSVRKRQAKEEARRAS